MNAPVVYEVHEDSLETEESVGMTKAQAIGLLHRGLITPRMNVHQFDVAPGVDPADVLEAIA